MAHYRYFEYERVGSEIQIKKYNGLAKSVNIPAQIDRLPVTSIGSNAFSNCRSLTSIVIPDSITEIGYATFAGCNSLTSITIPHAVTSIGGNSFEGCRSLTSVVIPNSVTSIGGKAFHYCRSLTSVVIPNSVTSIGDGAFNGCTSLTEIAIPEGVTSIGGNSFEDCSSLTNVVIPNSVTSIGDSAFSNCSSLTSIVIPNSVTSIGDNAFESCRSLTSIAIPDSVTSIGDNAFESCRSLTKIYFPKKLISSHVRNAIPNTCQFHYYDLPSRAFPKIKHLTTYEPIRFIDQTIHIFDNIRRLKNLPKISSIFLDTLNHLENFMYTENYSVEMNDSFIKILDNIETTHRLKQEISKNPIINLIKLLNSVSDKKTIVAPQYTNELNGQIAEVEARIKSEIEALEMETAT